MTKANATKPVIRQTVPPDDSMFMLVQRLKQLRDKITDPYSEDVWTHSAIAAVARPISSVPLVFYRRRADGAEMPPPGVRGRDTSQVLRARVRVLRKVLTKVSLDIIEYIASIPDAKLRFEHVRKLAPWATPSRLVRAVGDLEQVFSGPWVNLFRKPNPHCTINQLWEGTIVNLRSDGRCFWILRDQNGQPVDEGKIPAQIYLHSEVGFTAKVNKKTGELIGWEYKYKVDNKEQTVLLQPHQVILFHYFDRHNYLKGVSPVVVSKKWVEMVYYALTHNINFFKNGATIGGVLQTEEDLTTERRQQIEGELKAENAGVDKAFDTLVLSGGMKWINNQLSQKDMDFINGLNLARDATFAAHRTPRSVTGISEDYNRANQEASTKAHWEMNLIPEIVYLEVITNSVLMTEDRRGTDGVWAAFDLSQVEALREDLWQKMRTAKMMAEMGYTINAINKRLGLGMGDVPWGNTWYRPINTLPVNDLELKNPEAPKTKDKNKSGKDDSKGSTGNDGGGGDTNTNTGYASADQIAVYKRVGTTLLFGENEIKQRYRRFLTSELRAHQLQLVAEGSPTIFDTDDWGQKLREAMRSTYSDLYEVAAQEAAEELPSSLTEFSLSTSEAEVLIERLMDRLVEAVGRIAGELEKAYAELPNQLEAATKSVFNRLATGPRLAIIGVNESGNIVSAARDEVFRRAGVPATQWVRSRGVGQDRPTHSEYEAKGPVAYGESFSATVTIRRPHDPMAPANERLGCWCIVVPVTGNPEE